MKLDTELATDGALQHKLWKPRRAVGSRGVGQVHNDLAEELELLGLERFGEEVSRVVGRAHKGHVDLELLHHVAHEEMATLDVLGLVVMLRVVGEVAGAHIVGAQVRRAGHGRGIKAREQLAEVDLLKIKRVVAILESGPQV